MNLARERIMVTGGAGFLGRRVIDKLVGSGADMDRIIVPRRWNAKLTVRDWPKHLADLRCWDDVVRPFHKAEPTVVIHLAADCGGIGYNLANPGRLFHDNMIMGLHVVEACRVFNVKKVVCVGTVCAYPEITETPFRESDLWAGYPELTNAPYGVAKRALAVMLDGYAAQYGLESAYLLPANLYGPCDFFGPERSHVIPAMIRKFCRAVDRGQRQVTLWGSGCCTREFLHVDDCARAVVLAATHDMRGAGPINIGTGHEISIRDLAMRIAKLTGFDGRIRWDRSKPDGQPARRLDVRRAKQVLGFRAGITLAAGLRQTIRWWKNTGGA